MHPILTRAKWLAWYLLGWLIPAALAGSLLAAYGKVSWNLALALTMILAIPYSLLCLTPWYVCRMLPLREQNFGRAFINHLAAAFIASVLWTRAAGYLLPRDLFAHLPLIFATGILLYLLSVALHYVYLAVEASREAALREQQARVLAREAELKALKAQINPHFLFNCLNSISALTAIDPGQARDMCIRLSDFLRNTLRLGEREAIPLSEELSLVNTYLAVEQVRFGARLKVDRQIDDNCQDCVVPPLLLQPLVENAVKHGIASLVDGGTIRLSANCVGGSLRIEVENDFDPESPAPRKTGLGLSNVRNRIATRHGQRGVLEITVGEGRHRVDVLIPCEGKNL